MTNAIGNEHQDEAMAPLQGVAPATGTPTEAKAQAAHGAGRAKVIKRYSNRKLYDTERSKYVTLDEIAKMIKAGEEVAIIDNETKEDLTTVTLTQIIYEEEKRESRMPLSMLRNLIQTGGTTIQDFFDRSVKTPVVEIADTAQKSVEEVLQSAAQIRDAAISRVDELTDSARRIFGREERRTEEFRKQAVALCEELESKLKERLEEVRASVSAAGASGEAPSGEDGVPGSAAELAARHDVAAHAELLRGQLDRLRGLVDELDKLRS
jgi:polyhydroxyalkanoate synthesis repressor PhaR